MKREIRTLTAVYLFVLLILMISASFSGIMNIIVYILSFVLPLFFGIWASKKSGILEEQEGENLFSIKRRDIGISLSLVFPSVLLVLSVSLSTAFLFEALFGISQGEIDVLSGGSVLAVISYAILPAILEELLFRYLPIRLMGKRSPRFALILSAIFFALIHHSFFSIPYAFVAGIIFMAVDLSVGSVIPSMIIHFINNLIALLSMGAFGAELSIGKLFLFVGALSLLSLAYLFVKRQRVFPRLRSTFSSEGKYHLCAEPLFFAVPSLFIAVCELLLL